MCRAWSTARVSRCFPISVIWSQLISFSSWKGQNRGFHCPTPSRETLSLCAPFSTALTRLYAKLLGVNDDDITADYSLTTIGLQPIVPLLVARFQKQQAFKDNWKGTLNMAKSE